MPRDRPLQEAQEQLHAHEEHRRHHAHQGGRPAHATQQARGAATEHHRRGEQLRHGLGRGQPEGQGGRGELELGARGCGERAGGHVRLADPDDRGQQAHPGGGAAAAAVQDPDFGPEQPRARGGPVHRAAGRLEQRQVHQQDDLQDPKVVLLPFNIFRLFMAIFFGLKATHLIKK